MEFLDIENIILFHKKIVKQTGGSDGIRDLGLIESALNRGLMTFDGRELYESLEMKISVITHGLIRNHGFVDGNKRIGVAEGRLNEKDILAWIERHK